MPLCPFRRKYEQLEKERNIDMMEACWSARTHSTNKPSRKQPHRQEMHGVLPNCFISRHPGTGSTFTRGPCVFSEPTQGKWLKGRIWDRGTIHKSAVFVRPPSTPPFVAEPRTGKPGFSGMEPGHI
ncbi:hypothetical protein TNCV_4946231 [Trichonephila clavipes]|nr:hypothetical protein TNCV_4946231 [Trichonephila clavipes]